MPSPKKPKSRQEILKQQQQSMFVGREEFLATFRYNLALAPANWCFLLNVWGQGGIGKSTLLRQFRKIADEAGFITAYTCETETSVTEVMGRLAEQIEQKGGKLGQFSERYKVYRQKKQELEADPEAPQSFSAFLGRSLAKAGLGLAKQTPGSGAITPFLDEESIATQASEWASYVAKKLGNKDEVLLIQEPVEVLTPLFLQELSELANRANLMLLFDTYERTLPFLDDWFQEILEGRYGDLPINIILIISGREELDRNRWIDYEGSIARLALHPFTEDEAKQYLVRKGTTDPQIVDAILRLSGRLPLLVATLASESPIDPQQIGDASGTAVERFLKWVDNSQQRQIALDAALPRILNQDIITLLSMENTAGDLFRWLKQMPFVAEHLNGWIYHDIVRTQMMRHKKLTSPKSWASTHAKLADYYEELRNSLQANDEKHWLDKTWQHYALNHLYHRLCQMPQQYLSIALTEILHHSQ
jgi:hypothetical protein